MKRWLFFQNKKVQAYLQSMRELFCEEKNARFSFEFRSPTELFRLD